MYVDKRNMMSELRIVRGTISWTSKALYDLTKETVRW